MDCVHGLRARRVVARPSATHGAGPERVAAIHIAASDNRERHTYVGCTCVHLRVQLESTICIHEIPEALDRAVSELLHKRRGPRSCARAGIASDLG